MTKDLTEGRPFSLILSFSIPVLLGYLFQQFYNVVDTAIVGRTLGANALAAVGSTGALNFLIIGFCLGVSTGFTIPISQKFGAKNYSLMRKMTFNAIYLSCAFALVITIISVVLCRPILRLTKTPPDIIDNADAYFRIILIGIPFLFLYNFSSALMRALGDSKTPLVFLIFSSLLNIGLDLLTICVFKWGVRGAAFATVFSQGLAGILCAFYMIKKFSILRASKDEMPFNQSLAVSLCKFAVPMGLQYSITAIGSVMLQSSINSLGSETVAAIATGLKIHMFTASVYDALGTTMATYGGQNTGAQKYERLSAGVRDSMIISAIYWILVFVIMYFWGKNFIYLFLASPSQKILSEAHLFLKVNVGFYITLAAVNIFRFMIQGMGFSSFAMFSGLAEMIARTLMAVFAVPAFGIYGAVFASPMAWVLADCFLIPAFIHLKTVVKNAQIKS